MKKLVCLALVLVMTLAICACVGAEADFKFERPIEIVCPWGVGGGADGTIRAMQPMLQEILGVPVNISNKEGASGVTGVEYTYKQPADGYTFMLGTQSLFMSYMQGNMSMNFKEEFIPVDILVRSINCIVASKIQMEKYGVTKWSELQEYISAHPWEVTVALLSSGGVDGASLIEATKGLDLMQMPYNGGSEASSALAGGHCDLYNCGWDDVSGLIESGDIIPMLALCEHRMSIAPDLECSGELGIDSYMGPWRAIFAVKGTPEAAIETMAAAIAQAKETEEWKSFTHTAAYDEREIPARGADQDAFIESEWEALREYMVDQGTLVVDYQAQ